MQIYRVKKGDTLTKIAKAYRTTPYSLSLYNQLSDSDDLSAGQHLLILNPMRVYYVKQGDTLANIAEAQGISLWKLLQNNPQIVNPDVIYPGQRLVISFEDNPTQNMSVNGYAYPNIDRELLRQTLPYLTYLTIFSYGFTNEGELLKIDDSELIAEAKRYGAGAIMLVSALTENGSFSNELASRLINDVRMQDNFIENVIENMKEKGYIGLDMDFEFIYPQDADAYAALISKLKDRLNQEGFFLFVALAPKTSRNQQGLLYEGHNYYALGASSNVELIMTYEWGYTYGPPMAVAPLNKVREVVEYAVSEISPSKIYMGMPNYGYDWTLPYIKGESRAESISNVEAVDRAFENKAEIMFDSLAQSPFYSYRKDGKGHEVWFEDAKSIDAKVKLAMEYSLAGLSYWNIMRPFLQNWMLLSNLININKIY
ncbi:MAG: LysM peptidoglycan-binding domain-containing protein [Clostridiales bacterium]|nr:LysM peptidoglycan-binding domain-containing protein [Clostridiales bacterium]